MNNVLNRAKYVVKGEEGDLNLQALGLIAVALFVMGALFVFRDKVDNFIRETAKRVEGIQKEALDGSKSSKQS